MFLRKKTQNSFQIFYSRALDKNEYNHITATYFLLAERKLRAYRQEQAQKRRQELTLPVSTGSKASGGQDSSCEISNNLLMPPSLTYINTLRTPGADGSTVIRYYFYVFGIF